MATQFGTLGTIDTITVGGRVFTNLSTLITLLAHGTAANMHFTARKPFVASGYAPSGVQFNICAVKYTTNTNQSEPLLAYGDNDVGQNSSSAMTNAVYVLTTGGQMGIMSSNVAGGPAAEIAYTGVLVPSGKYVGGNNGSGQAVWVIYGYEV